MAAIETASASAAALARAGVEARYIMAMRQPRNIDSVRLKILDACKRTSFAEAARYAKPIGGSKVEGPSIRFAEEAARALGNLQIEGAVVHEDQERRIVRITVTDLEANLTYPSDIVVAKQVERSRVKDGQQVLGQRLNSKGMTVFIVEATEDELLVKQAALTSKAVRTAVLRLLPGDILDEAMDQCIATLRKQDEQDPTAARKKLTDAFHGVGVRPEDLELYLGHQLAQCTPAELQDLRQVYAALKEGEATWQKVMETRNGGAPAKDDAPPAVSKRSSKLDAIKGAAVTEAPAQAAPATPPAEEDLGDFPSA
jgi:hypothetical protein